MKNFSILLLLLFTHVGIAQSTVNNYTIKWVNEKNGLKQLSVRYCVPDNNGFIWIATELGLYRYDGSNLKEINEEKFPSLSKQRITRLGKDYLTGKIYLEVNPESCQYVIENNKIKKVDPKKQMGNIIFTFNDYCFTQSYPLVKKVFENYKTTGFLKEYSSNTFITASLTPNYLYLPQFESLIAFDKKGSIIKFDHHFTRDLVLIQFEENVLALDNGEIILISEGKIVKKKINIDERIQSYLKRKLKSLSDIEVFGSKNNYYLKYKGEIFQIRFNNNTLTTEFLFKSPAEDIASISYLQKENIYLIGTHTQGMAILTPKLFNTILFDERNSNKSINYCYAATTVSDTKWFSSSGWEFDAQNKVAKVDTFLINNMNTRFILPYKNKFYVEAKDNLWNIESKKKDSDFYYPRTLKNRLRGLLSGFTGYTYHKGQLCLTDAYLIYFLNNKTFTTDDALNNKFEGKYINAIGSVNDNLLVLTTKGVYSYSTNSKKLSIVKGLEKVNARYVKVENNTRFWVGCYGEGLFLVDHNKVYKVTDKNIETPTAHAVEEDANGDLWISTNDGLLKTNKKEAIRRILNNQPLDFYKYSKEDGLLTNEFNGGGTHPSLKTNDGIIGFPSMKGFVWFVPTNVPKHLFKGSIVMDKVVVDNKKTIPFVNNCYSFPNEFGVVTFNFSYGYYYNRENLTITYRFDDQKNWTEIKGNSVQLGRHKRGTHKLLLRITTHGFGENKSVIQTFQLDFGERYYETVWFWILVLIGFLSVIYLAYLLGLHFRKKNQQLLERKIDEKTTKLQELIIELEVSKNSVNQSLNEKEVLLKEVHHRVKNNLQLIISMLNIQARRNNYIDIYDFLKKGETRISSMALIHQRLYQSEDSLNKINFQLYLEDLVNSISQTFENSSQKVRITVDTNNVILSLSTAIPLGLIINELVTNSLKYAFPDDRKGSITIQIIPKGLQEYELIVEDNGIGFSNEKKQTKSFGIELINLLALQLEGSVNCDNSVSTKYTIRFKEIELK
jgi:two-component sensor histidine kinase